MELIAQNSERVRAVPFEVWFEHFRSGEDLRSFAKKIGIAHTRLYKIYEAANFGSILGNKSLSKRRVERTRARYLDKALADLEIMLSTHETLASIKAHAQKHDCQVKGVIRTNSKGYAIPDDRLLCINGHAYVACSGGTVLKIGDCVYVKVSINTQTLKEAEGAISHVRAADYPEHFLVIPKSRLEKQLRLRKATIQLYLRLDGPSQRRPTSPNEDWWKFEDAWHLLSPLPDTNTPA